MMSFKYSEIIFYFLIFVKFSDQQLDNTINFDLPDLTIDYESYNGRVSLEAFEYSSNDLIIQNNFVSKYSQLQWATLGYPQIVSTQNPTNFSSFLNFRSDGFDLMIEMLTSYQKSLFKQEIKRKYNIDIDSSQIKNLIPSSLKCKIIFYYDTDKILINGQANRINSFPTYISFKAKIDSKERILFEQALTTQELNNKNFQIICDVLVDDSSAKKSFVLHASDMLRLGLGKDSCLTTDQLFRLARDVYINFNIQNEYQVSETHFVDNFVDIFRYKTSFEYVAFDQALENMYKNSLLDSFNSSSVKEELNRLFSLLRIGTREILELNSTQYDKMLLQSNLNYPIWRKGSFYEIRFAVSAIYAQTLRYNWETLKTPLRNQLSELNNYSESEIEWAKNGTLVIAKSIKCLKLTQEMLQKNLVLTQTDILNSETTLQKTFILNIKNLFYNESDSQQDYTVLQVVEDNLSNLSDRSNNLSSNYEPLKSQVDTNFTSFSQSITTLTANYETMDRNILNNYANITQSISSLESKYLILKQNNVFNYMNFTSLLNQMNSTQQVYYTDLTSLLNNYNILNMPKIKSGYFDSSISNCIGSLSYYINFGTTFSVIPKVVLSYKTYDSAYWVNLRTYIYADSISTDKFRANFYSWGDSCNYAFSFFWIAYDDHR